MISMKVADLSDFVCPECAAPLAFAASVSTETIDEGMLLCTSCTAEYPIRQGLPRFVGGENYASSFGFQWNTHRRTQLDSFSGLTLSRDRLFSVSGWPEKMSGQRILEAGSGSGRFTEILLKTGANVYSFDYSNAVDANHQNNADAGNLHLFQGDIFKIPFRPGYFDKVMCLGVLQHTPDPALAFSRLAAAVRPGGELVVDLYRKSLPAMLNWKYLLRGITKRVDSQVLYRFLERVVPPLVPVSAFLRTHFGAAGMRLIPILQYHHWGIPDPLNSQWAILDTFDMYAPAYDKPQSIATVQSWFERTGFEDIAVGPGPNGVIGKGRKS
jgi:SAM-dependent methyltransferase